MNLTYDKRIELIFMLRFFQKMRNALIPESRFGRYFFYALGEIMLVVIGILIALQVNNWNEERKIKNQEIIFFTNIIDDLDNDCIKLSFLKEFHLKRIDHIDTLLFFIRNPEIQMGIEKFGIYVEPLYYVEDPTCYSTTFESATSSATFNGFRQKALIKELTEYYADFIRLQSTIESIRTIIERQMEPVLSSLTKGYINSHTGKLVISEDHTGDFYNNVGSIKDNRNDKADYESVLENPQFESYLIGDLGRTFGALGIIEARQHRIKTIEKKINDYLNHN